MVMGHRDLNFSKIETKQNKELWVFANVCMYVAISQAFGFCRDVQLLIRKVSFLIATCDSKKGTLSHK